MPAESKTPPPEAAQADLAETAVPDFASLVHKESTAHYARSKSAVTGTAKVRRKPAASSGASTPPPEGAGKTTPPPVDSNNSSGKEEPEKEDRSNVAPGGKKKSTVRLDLSDMPVVEETGQDDDDDEVMRGSLGKSSTLSQSGRGGVDVPEAVLQEALKHTRTAKRKVSRVHGKAEAMCEDFMAAHVETQKNILSPMRLCADELGLACVRHGVAAASQNDSTTFHQRYLSLQDEYRDLLHFELAGHHERANYIKTTVTILEGEVYRRASTIAAQYLCHGAEGLPEGVSVVTERTLIDVQQGLAIHCMEHAHGAAKNYVKSLTRFVNLCYNPFFVPLTIALEVYGLSFIACTVPPLAALVRNPMEQADMRFGVEACVSELHLDFDEAHARAHSLFATALDGRVYCLYAYGMLPAKYPNNFLNLLDPTKPHDPDTLDSLLNSRMDHAAVEAVAMSRAGGGQIAKAMHRNGLRVSQLGTLHGFLSRQEIIRQSNAGSAPDPNLAGALTSCIGELLARTLKCILRRLWGETIARDKDISMEDKPREMAVLAHQLINVLIVDNHSTRTRSDQQLYHTVAKLSRHVAPLDPKLMRKKERFVWEDVFVSEVIVAIRVAAMCGLRFVDGVMAGVTPGRLVRSTKLIPRDLWYEVHRGRHQEVMKRLVSQIKHVRLADPVRAFHLTCQLGDIFHQAQGRSGVTRRPVDLFDKAAWLRSNERGADQDLADSTQLAKAADEAGDAYAERRELCILRILALQAIAVCDKEIAEAEAARREQQAQQQAANMVSGAAASKSPKPAPGITPLELGLGPSPTAQAGIIPMLKMPSPAGLGGMTPTNGGLSGRATSARGGGAKHKVPPAAQAAHSEALQALQAYVRRSMEIFRDTGAVEATKAPLSRDAIMARRRHMRGICETLFRTLTLARAAAALRDRQVSEFIDATLKTLERFRKAGVLDARGGGALWNQLYEAQTASLLHVDPEGAINAAKAKMQHAILIHGPSSIQVAACHSDIGAVLLGLGRHVEGRQELEVGFRHMTQVAPLCTATFTAANNLGYTYFRTAERSMDPTQRRRRHGFLKMALSDAVKKLLDEAEAAFNFVIENRVHASNITVADAMNNLGSVKTFRGQYSLAVPFFEQSLALTRGIYADDHPDRASAIRNMRTCERRMRANAALRISCYFKRFRARRQLALLQRGAMHVEMFQRVGRAYADRLRLFQLAEYRTIRNMGRGGFGDDDDGGAQQYYGDEDDDVYGADPGAAPASQAAGNAGASGAASPVLPVPGVDPLPTPGVASTNDNTPEQSEQQHRPEALPGQVHDDGAADGAAAAPEEKQIELTDAQKAALVQLQSAGRGCLTRAMIRKIYLFRQKKKKRAAKK